MKNRSSHPGGSSHSLGNIQELLNKFPLSYICYSRAENGRSPRAGGQGQSGAAATRRAEGAR